MKKRSLTNRSGFTFVELLVVITIIGIIFASGIVGYSAITSRTRDARRKSDLEAIRQALEMCRSLTGSYPDTIYTVTTPPTVTCTGGTPVVLSNTPIEPKNCAVSPEGKYAYNRPSATVYTLSAPCMEGAPYELTNP